MSATHKLWKHIVNSPQFQPVISSGTITELGDSPSFLKDHFSVFLKELSPLIVDETSEIQLLFEEYKRLGVLGEKNTNDLRHISCAAYYGCDMIVSWNFRHFVNEYTIAQLRKANKILRRDFIEMISPFTFLERLQDERLD